MSPELFLQRLYELKQFLKENPERRPVYADVPVDFLINDTLKKLSERKKDNVQDRPLFDDFIPATDIPF